MVSGRSRFAEVEQNHVPTTMYHAVRAISAEKQLHHYMASAHWHTGKLSNRPQVSVVYVNNSRHLARKYARIFVRGHYLFRTVFRERSSRKTVSYEEQIMSKDKYPSIFSPQMEVIFKIGEYSRIFHSFSWGIFGHVTRLGQSRASEKI